MRPTSGSATTSTTRPDETRTFEAGRLDLLKVGGSVGRLTLQPGWRWGRATTPSDVIIADPV